MHGFLQAGQTKANQATVHTARLQMVTQGFKCWLKYTKILWDDQVHPSYLWWVSLDPFFLPAVFAGWGTRCIVCWPCDRLPTEREMCSHHLGEQLQPPQSQAGCFLGSHSPSMSHTEIQHNKVWDSQIPVMIYIVCHILLFETQFVKCLKVWCGYLYIQAVSNISLYQYST